MLLPLLFPVSDIGAFELFSYFGLSIFHRFQEIVPLNAGNVLGTEDNIPAKKWVSLIRRSLNKNPGTSGCGGYHTPSPVLDPVVELDADFEGSARRQGNFSLFHRRSFHNLSRSLRMDGDLMVPQPMLDRRFSVCDPVNLGGRPSDFDGVLRCPGSPDEDNVDVEAGDGAQFSPFPHSYNASATPEPIEQQSNSSRYSHFVIHNICYFISKFFICMVDLSTSWFMVN
jgi:hypothetical protein